MAVSTMPGKVLWLRAKDLTGASVTTWADQSGLGHDAVSSAFGGSATVDPTLDAGVTPAGGAAVRFGLNGRIRVGTYKALALPDLGLSTAGEMWVVVKGPAATGAKEDSPGPWVFGPDAADRPMWPYFGDGKIYETFGASIRSSWTPTAGLSLTDWHIYRVASDGTFTAWIDNVQQFSAARTVAWNPAPVIGRALGANGTFDSQFGGWIAELLVFDRRCTAAEVSELYTYFNGEHGTTVVPPPPPDLTGTLAATLPSLQASLTGEVTPPPTTGTLAGVLPAVRTALTGAVALSAVTGSLDATLPALAATLTGEVTPPATTGALAATLPSLQASLAGEVTQPEVFDAIGVRSEPRVTILSIPIAATPPLGVDPVPVVRYSHVAPALSMTNPTMQEGVDYPSAAPVEVGTLHVWVDGQDVTYLGGAPIQMSRWSATTPAGDAAATFEVPAMQAWDRPGVGAWSMLRPDAPVDVALVHKDGTRTHVWSGFLSADAADVGSTKGNGFTASGTLWQAGVTLHEPPHYLPPTDVGTLVARALNGVTGRRWSAIPEVKTGILTRNRGSGNQSVIQYVLDLLASAWTDDGRQWTLVEVAPREFRVELKAPLTTADATVTYGAPGIEVDLSREQSTRIDVIYGRGVAPNGGRWRGTRFPGLVIAAPPPYPNASAAVTIHVGDTDADTDSGDGVTVWQRRMVELGYGLAVDGRYDAADADATRRLQRNAGLLVDGVLGPQTWAATFNRGPEGIDLTQWREPIAAASWAQPDLRDPAGVVLSSNPSYDPSRIPHEVEVDFGTGITWAQAQPLARRMLAVESTPGLTGRVTLRTDPHERSRFEVRPGSRLRIVGHQGEDVIVRVAAVDGDATGSEMALTLTVDERSRDALSVEAILERNRAALPDPARRPGSPDRDSRVEADRTVQWDVDSPCGFLPRTAVYADLWTVPQPVPMAEVGRIAKIMLTSTVPFTIALFGKAVQPNQVLAAVGDPHASADPWTAAADTLDRLGWIESWGSQGQRCGFSPGAEGESGFTGRWEERGSVDFVSAHPPYVWVALFASTPGFVGGASGEYGRFYPGTD